MITITHDPRNWCAACGDLKNDVQRITVSNDRESFVMEKRIVLCADCLQRLVGQATAALVGDSLFEQMANAARIENGREPR